MNVSATFTPPCSYYRCSWPQPDIRLRLTILHKGDNARTDFFSNLSLSVDLKLHETVNRRGILTRIQHKRASNIDQAKQRHQRDHTRAYAIIVWAIFGTRTWSIRGAGSHAKHAISASGVRAAKGASNGRGLPETLRAGMAAVSILGTRCSSFSASYINESRPRRFSPACTLPPFGGTERLVSNSFDYDEPKYRVTVLTSAKTFRWPDPCAREFAHRMENLGVDVSLRYASGRAAVCTADP